jgi:SAM-dependent methyltransferase
MELAPRRRALSFGAAADLYARARPTYAERTVRFCLPAVPCRVADVGAGTGTLTEALLRLGCTVVAVEPDDAMRALIAGADARAGAAEALPLERGEVDAIVCGQAFHWFDADRFVAESARVLPAGGTLGVLWNELDDSVPWVAAYCDATDSGERASSHEDAGVPFRSAAFTEPERLDARHAVAHDAESLAALAATYSRMILREPAEREAALARVRRLAPAGEVELPYLTKAWRAYRV